MAGRLTKAPEPNELWPDLEVAEPADGEGPRAIQALLTQLGVTWQAWQRAPTSARQTAAEFARAVLRMGLTVAAALDPARLVPEYALESVRVRALAKLSVSAAELGQKSTGTQSIRELVHKHALHSSAREMLHALTSFFEKLKRKLEKNPGKLHSMNIGRLNERLRELESVDVGLRYLPDHQPLVTKDDLADLLEKPLRDLALRVTQRAFGDAISADELRRSKPKRTR